MCNIASEFTKILKSDELACAIVSVYWCTCGSILYPSNKLCRFSHFECFWTQIFSTAFFFFQVHLLCTGVEGGSSIFPNTTSNHSRTEIHYLARQLLQRALLELQSVVEYSQLNLNACNLATIMVCLKNLNVFGGSVKTAAHMLFLSQTSFIFSTVTYGRLRKTYQR